MEGEHQQQLLGRLVTYVPFFWVRKVFDNPRPPEASSEWRHGAVLTAELSGLGTLAEQAGRLGHAGADELSRLLNLSFSALLEQAIFPLGGQLVRAGGSPLVCFFLGEQSFDRAAACGLRLRNLLESHGPRIKGEPALGVKAAVSRGPIYLAQIGSPHERMEVVVAGPALIEALNALEEARPGELVTKANPLEPTTGLFVGTAHGSVVPVSGVKDPPIDQPLHDIAPQLATHTLAKINALRPFLPPDLFDHFLADPTAPAPPAHFARATVLLSEFWSIDPAAPTSKDAFNQRFLLAHRVVLKHGGVLSRLDFTPRGRKLTALFGVPEPRGSDEERALHCALELRAALGAQQMRAAVNTGFVFMGEVGSALKREHAVVGESLQVATRLLASADEGSILAGPETWRAGGSAFELGPAWLVRIKGQRNPVSARTVVRARDRVRATVSPGKLAGRARELSRALIAVDQLLRDGGGLVVRASEGMGKTRFLRELVAQAKAQSKHKFEAKRLRCSYLTREHPFGLLQACVQALSGESLPLAAWLESKRSLCASQVKTLGEFKPWTSRNGFFELISKMASDALAELARNPKTLLVVDDLHLADTESLAVLRSLAQSRKLSVLASSTPELIPGPELAELSLPPLDSVALTELCREQLGEAPPALVSWLDERSGGSAVQARALIAWLLETDALDRGPHGVTLRSTGLEPVPPILAAATVPEMPAIVLPVSAPTNSSSPYPVEDDSGPHPIPDVLRTDPVLMAAPSAKAASPSSSTSSAPAPASTSASSARPPSAPNLAGVESAATRSRQQTHRQLAELIEGVPGAAQERLEELAILFGESDRPEKAVFYARAAATRAADRGQLSLALRWAEAAARSAQMLDDEHIRLEVRLEEALAWQRLFDPQRAYAIAREVWTQAGVLNDDALALRSAVVAASSLADGCAPEAEGVCRTALALAEAARQPLARARCLIGLARALRSRGELAEASFALERAMEFGVADEELRLLALVQSGLVRAEQGEAERARAALETAAVLSSSPRLLHHRAVVLLNLAVVRGIFGDVPGATDALRESEKLARDLGLVVPRAAALVNLSDLHRDGGDLEHARSLADEARQEAARAGDARVAAAALVARALSSSAEDDALGLAEEAISQLQALDDASLFIESATGLARLAMDRGRPRRARELFTAARARAEATGIERHRRALDRLDEILRRAPPEPATFNEMVTAPGA